MAMPMRKVLLPLALLLGLTACHERIAPEPETSKFTDSLFSSAPSDDAEEAPSLPITTPVVEANTEDTRILDVPILEDDLPIIPIASEKQTAKPMSKPATTKKVSSGGQITDGLDMKTIRVSNNTERTRIVLDSYTSTQNKASVSGHYDFKYLPKEHRIILIVNGYRHFTALGKSRERHFSNNPFIQKIYLVPYADDSGFQCNIDLKKAAKVNAFDIKEPGRIVIDIMPN